MSAKAPQINSANLKSKEKTRGVMGLYGTTNTVTPKDNKAEEKLVSEEPIIETEVSKATQEETQLKQPAAKSHKKSVIGKANLHVTIDKDIYEYLDELVEETRDNKSVIVNKILYRYMKENRQ